MQIWNGSDEYCWRYRADTILSTDGQTDKVIPVYPPFNFVEAGGITNAVNQPVLPWLRHSSLRLRQEREIKFIGLFGDRGHQGPYSTYNTAPSRADPVVVFPLCRWCPPQETSQPHPPQRLRQNGHYFDDGTMFKLICLEGHWWILVQILIKIVVPMDPVNNMTALVYVMVWYMPLSEPMLVLRTGALYINSC